MDLGIGLTINQIQNALFNFLRGDGSNLGKAWLEGLMGLALTLGLISFVFPELRRLVGEMFADMSRVGRRRSQRVSEIAEPDSLPSLEDASDDEIGEAMENGALDPDSTEFVEQVRGLSSIPAPHRTGTDFEAFGGRYATRK